MKDTYTNKVGLAPEDTASKSPVAVFFELINLLIKILSKLGVLRRDLDYHVVRASMVIIYFFFGYQNQAATPPEHFLPSQKSKPPA